MKLTDEQLISAIRGASYFTVEEGAIFPHRFTKAEEDYYEEINESFFRKALSGAGMRIAFRTNATELSLKARVEQGSSRSYYSFDVTVNSERVASFDNFEGRSLCGNYVGTSLPLRGVDGRADLGLGEKLVEIILPWSVRVGIEELCLNGGDSFSPVKREKLLLAYGDSITQGYDALRPSNCYATGIASDIGADLINKAIGGEIFVPKLANLADKSLNPDYVTVAYGVNDWGKCASPEIFYSNAKGFYTAISKTYPNSKIFAVTPIWYAAIGEVRGVGKFEDLSRIINEAVNDLANVTPIEGFGFVPPEPKYFGDLRLHPNDEGFAYYRRGLSEKIKSIIGAKK